MKIKINLNDCLADAERAVAYIASQEGREGFLHTYSREAAAHALSEAAASLAAALQQFNATSTTMTDDELALALTIDGDNLTEAAQVQIASAAANYITDCVIDYCLAIAHAQPDTRERFSATAQQSLNRVVTFALLNRPRPVRVEPQRTKRQQTEYE